jgi:hypothetical protein
MDIRFTHKKGEAGVGFSVVILPFVEISTVLWTSGSLIKKVKLVVFQCSIGLGEI